MTEREYKMTSKKRATKKRTASPLRSFPDPAGDILINTQTWRDCDLKGAVVMIHEPAAQGLFLCSSGFGTAPRATGSAVFGTWLSTGHEDRVERRDIVGVVLDDTWKPHDRRDQEKVLRIPIDFKIKTRLRPEEARDWLLELLKDASGDIDHPSILEIS